ncbi:kinase-like domain-containing protein [Delphinella strobiligena]|nr:kinase-like domain-containing protein [Delphinella strobiligena]
MKHPLIAPTWKGPSSESLPINATLFRRVTTLCAFSLLKHVCRSFGNVLFLPRSICIKYGDLVDLAEAASMDLVRQHTSVPVPKIYCSFTHRGQTYIVMEKMKGHKLAIGFTERSEESKSRLLAQLRSMVDEIRAIQPQHGTRVASVDGGSLYDMRLPGLGVVYPVRTPWRFGPFDDVKAFHLWLRQGIDKIDDRYTPDLKNLIAMHQSKDWGLPVFTHGDLSSLNVLVKGETITGIVDWETAGWYPSYWEYTTASQVNFRNQFWAAYIDRFLEPKKQELEMERLRMICSGC